jgi:hypothetical protein
MTDDERIDLVLTEMVNNGIGRLNIQKYLSETLKDIDPHSFRRLTVFLVDKGWVRRIHNVPFLEILPDGREIVDSGGYVKYLQRLKRNQVENADAQTTERELNSVNLKLNGFYLKYKWIPFVLSLIAILLSVAALIISSKS